MRTSADTDASTADRYRLFAEREADPISPIYAALARRVVADSALLALVDELPGPKRQPNLVFSAALFHGAPVGDPDAFAAWLVRNWPTVKATALARRTQTNEAARCALHLPILAQLPGPLALLEVGTSAGLCLHPDRYSYRYGDHPQVDPAGGPSPVVIECAVDGPVPVPDRLPEVVWRAGIDANPLDVADEGDLAWLEALVWPEYDDRRARVRAAATLAASDPVRIVAGDLNDGLAALAAEAPRDATLVVFHTAVLAYLSDADRARFVAQVRGLPGHWISCEGEGVVPGIAARDDAPHESSDFVLALDGRQVAWAQPHGRALRWLAGTPGAAA